MARVVSDELVEQLLKKELNTNKLESTGHFGGGCINEGQSYETDSGVVFVKINKKKESRCMFEGEFSSIEALRKTETIFLPRAIKVLDHPGGSGAMLVMEHVDMTSLKNHQAMLGEQLARLHLHNVEKLAKGEADAVSKFGFAITTCCGYIPQQNQWDEDWVMFYTKRRLEHQLEILQKEHNDLELQTLWEKLKVKIPEYFSGLEIKPSLLHGDLWAGNVGETKTKPVTFDPASFYGHHEFELGIAGMFGGFSDEFYSAYHKLIPKAPGFDDRHKLYQLFHFFNHWHQSEASCQEENNLQSMAENNVNFLILPQQCGTREAKTFLNGSNFAISGTTGLVLIPLLPAFLLRGGITLEVAIGLLLSPS